MRLIDVDFYCATICRCNRIECDKANCPIHNAPTAYDIDKVVEELEELREIDMCDIALCPIENIACSDCTHNRMVDKSIEIVKQSCVYADVCEWESVSDGEFIKNPHTKRLYSNEPSMKNIYCNTCGKKIKAVK